MKKTNAARRGVTVIELLIGVAAMACVVGGIAAVNVGCSDIVYPHNVSGRVVLIDSRLARSQGGTDEKFVLRLDSITMADSVVKKTAGGPGGVLDVECLSTRCALLKPGACVDLECNREVRWWEPNVIQCKLVKETVCTGTPAPAATRE